MGVEEGNVPDGFSPDHVIGEKAGLGGKENGLD
jgi:hypothetical protein